MLSQVSLFHFQGYDFYVKRDELIDPLLSGNKYRKLYELIQTPSATYSTIISYGGIQSNAMLAIAALCQKKSWAFHYYCKPIQTRIQEKPDGNYKIALELGMKAFPTENYDSKITQLKNEGKTLVIPQGGADALAKKGLEVLADEIKQWQQQVGIQSLSIVTPSGTGTTSYYLAKALPDYKVLTTATIGDNDYLKQQMLKLGNIPSNLELLEPERKYHFAKPYPEFLHTYQSLKDSGIEFDLIYAPKMWLTLLANMQNIHGAVLYVHSGGLLGNLTMLARYQHKGYQPKVSKTWSYHDKTKHLLTD
ncbi:MAG: 1-aminocyclopropane-1-carboxylate deaminase [Ghiorsea sp.]